MSIHIHTFPWYYFSFLIIKCIYATPKHPRQQAECWLMRLTFLLKLLMVRCRLGFFFWVVFFFFLVVCIFSFLLFLIIHMWEKCVGVFSFFFPASLFLPISWILSLRLSNLQSGGLAERQRQYQPSVYAFALMDFLTFFRRWTWSAWVADGSWASELNNSQSSSVSDMLQSAWWSKEHHCGSDMFPRFELLN